jgi:hypothetical protein
VSNLGPIANAKGRIDIQIRDLDQTVIGNPAHDLVRLGLSLASAARGSDLPGVATAMMIEKMIEGYEHAFAALKAGVAQKAAKPETVKLPCEVPCAGSGAISREKKSTAPRSFPLSTPQAMPAALRLNKFRTEPVARHNRNHSRNSF